MLELYVGCYNLGYPLQELTFPGQNPSRTLSTSSLVGSSTVPGATSVSPTAVPVSPTSVSKTTVNVPSTSPASSGAVTGSSTSPASSGTVTGSSTATSSTSTPTGAALGLVTGGVWALAAAVIGFVA